MTSLPTRILPFRDRALLSLAILAFGSAATWLLLRIFVGLDLTDEMQYYGEIAGIVRTGRLFHDDLFLQQLGYFFLLPLFKLHAVLFPDQSYLLIFGRVVLLGLYSSVGLLFWTCTRRLGFSATQRLTGLAAFLAWIPFQIFAPGYNSLSYLLLVALIAVWINDVRPPSFRRKATIAALLVALTVTYPPAGIVSVLLATIETFVRHGTRIAWSLLALTLGASAFVGATMMAMHGLDFFVDLISAVEFSRAFGVGETIREPKHLARLGVFVMAGCCLALRLGVLQSLHTGMFGSRAPWLHAIILGGASAVLFISSVRWSIGYFATAVFLALLLLAALCPSTVSPRRALPTFALFGIALGVVYSITSGNGAHNFGLGAAPAIPFLVLYAVPTAVKYRQLDLRLAFQSGLASIVTLLILLNGLWHPYRERYEWSQLKQITDVPAFKGIWTSTIKIEALKMMAELAPPGSLRGKRVLVAGPHAAFYFVSGGEPATPMFFMHYTGNSRAYSLVAERLFRKGEPDEILVTNTMPEPIHAQIEKWKMRGMIERRIAVPSRLIQHYQELIGYDFLPEVILMSRSP